MMESDKNCAICGIETHSSNSRKFGYKDRTLCRACGVIITEAVELYTDDLIDGYIKGYKEVAESKVKNET